ncbi:amidohydrolase [Vibrio astriarenae]|uniref:amidohydrolase n=1 Tax=Vibrio astriarenae TaxID=1481923 RepID=UPI003736783C
MDKSLKAFSAKKIITMNPSLPSSEVVVFDGDKIIATGPMSMLADYPGVELDKQFQDHVIVPGFVEGHCHAMEGSVWKYQYLGYFSRLDPNGVEQKGVSSYEELKQKISTIAKSKGNDDAIICWGFDPIYFSDDRLSRRELDEACSHLPVVVIHANFHVMTVNTAMLEKIGMSKLEATEGVLKDNDGYPNGELLEMAAMGLVFQELNETIFDTSNDPDALNMFAKSANNKGITTITDLFNPLTDETLAILKEVTSDDSFSVRLVPAMSTHNWSIAEGTERFLSLKEQGNEKLHFPIVKLMTDGSIQGYTARLLEPGYHDGHENGLWNCPLQEVSELFTAYHNIGATIHVHTNGDEAVEVMLNTIEQAITQYPAPDHRHTLQHCQMINHAQMRRASKFGICLNMFINHIYYWGDIHRELTLGYERVQRLEPVNTSMKHGIVTAVHSDAPVTPLGPLFSMWCATNRETATQQLLGEHEKVTAYQALEMVTLNPAYTLKLDHLVGSIEAGKYADFAVLDQDPLEVDCSTLKDINVAATIIGGVIVKH